MMQESGEEQGLPVQGTCRNCGAGQVWADVLSKCESVPWRQSRSACAAAAADHCVYQSQLISDVGLKAA